MIDGLHVIAQDDLMAWMREAQRLKPSAVHFSPPTPPDCGEDPLAEQELAQLMPVSQEIDAGVGTRPAHIAQRFVGFIRNPHWRQVATPQQPR
jgi:hypothetical protein